MGLEAAARPRTRRGASETRAELLDAAEVVFAERGYAAARLEDVADRVGIRRASIVYHFRDKPELYAATLAHVVGDLREALHATLTGPGSAAERIERTVLTWAEYVGRRPSIAKLLLREVADARPERIQALRGSGEVVDLWISVVQRGQAEEGFSAVDPVQLASMLIGATVFFFSATHLLAPSWPFDPTGDEQVRSHREELLRITRRLLGTRGPRRLPSGSDLGPKP